MNVDCAKPLAEFISKFSWCVIAMSYFWNATVKCHNFIKTKITKIADQLHKMLSSNYLYNLSWTKTHPQGVKLPTNNMEQNLWFPAAKNNGCSLLLPILPSKAKCILTQPQSSWIQAFILIRIPSASHAASSLPDPQSNNSPASHVHTCPSWAAAMATHGNFFPPDSMLPDFQLPSSLSFYANLLLKQSKTQLCTDVHR